MIYITVNFKKNIVSSHSVTDKHYDHHHPTDERFDESKPVDTQSALSNTSESEALT